MKRLTLKEVYLVKEYGPDPLALEDRIVDRLEQAVKTSKAATELVMKTNNAVVARDALKATQMLNKLYRQFLNKDY